MARIAGVGGNVVMGTVTVTGIKEWSVDYTQPVVDTSGFDNTQGKTFLPLLAISEWAGAFSGFRDGGPQALSTGATGTISLKDSTVTGQMWTGPVIITGMHPSRSFDGAALISYDFQGSGLFTVATA